MKPSITPPQLKRRANLLYKLRNKGINCDTRKKTIFCDYDKDIREISQARKLIAEFHFVVQIQIV